MADRNQTTEAAAWREQKARADALVRVILQAVDGLEGDATRTEVITWLMEALNHD